MKRYWPLLLICAVNAACLWPELTPTPDLNDNVLHVTLINGIANALEHGQNPFDFWSPEIGLGQPIVKLYQPGAHAIVVALYVGLFKLVPLMTVFMWVRFLSLALIPLTFYATANLLDLPRPAQLAAAMLAPLVSGDSFGIDYGSYVWAGIGLFPQAVATHFLLLAIGFGWRAIRRGNNWILPAVLLALTGWCNLLYGYVGAFTLCIVATIPTPCWTPPATYIVPRDRFWQLLKIGLFGALCALPKLIAWTSQSQTVFREIGARAFMYDSFGASKVLHDAFTGQLLDRGRLPVLTCLVGLGIIVAIFKKSSQATFLIAGCGAWLMLYFGRPFWGDALYLVGITSPFQLHRLIGPVQMFSILLAAIALSWFWERQHSGYALLAIALILSPAIQERRTYLAQNAIWAAETRAAFTVDGPSIEAALDVAKQRGGRAYAGLPATWGGTFRIGSVPVYSLFPPRQIPCVGYLYIGFLSRNWSIYDFNDRNPTDYKRMDVRTVITPVGMPPLPSTSLIAVYGRFAVYRTGV
jgi:hypothetical protein